MLAGARPDASARPGSPFQDVAACSPCREEANSFLMRMSERLALGDRVLEAASLHEAWRARRDQAAAAAAAAASADVAQERSPEHEALLRQGALLAGTGRVGLWGPEACTRRVLHPASLGASGRPTAPAPWLRALSRAAAALGLEAAAGTDAQAEALGLALAMGFDGPAGR